MVDPDPARSSSPPNRLPLAGDANDPAPIAKPPSPVTAGATPADDEVTAWSGGWATETSEPGEEHAKDAGVEGWRAGELDEAVAEAAADQPPAVDRADPDAGQLDGAESGAPEAPTEAKPGKSRGSKEERAAARARKRQQAAEGAIEDADDSNPALGPLVRHLNTVTKELALAYRTIGIVTAERDAYRRQVYELQGTPVPAADDAPQPNRDARQVAKTQIKLARLEARGIDTSLTPEELEEQMRRTARRRQIIAVAVLATLAIGFVVANQMGYDVGQNFSRGSLASIAYIGPVINIFLVGFILFRIVRVSTNARRWLFPNAESSRKRRR